MPKIKLGMTTLEEFREAASLVRSCRGTVACGCKMDIEEQFAGDALYIACKDFVKAYAERFPAWRGLP